MLVLLITPITGIETNAYIDRSSTPGSKKRPACLGRMGIRHHRWYRCTAWRYQTLWSHFRIRICETVRISKPAKVQLTLVCQIRNLRRQPGRELLFSVAEYWSSKYVKFTITSFVFSCFLIHESSVKLFLPYIYAFQGQVSMISQLKPYMYSWLVKTAFFDVPLHYNFHRASEEGSGYDLRRIFKGTLVQVRPGDAVTFVDNHELS